VNPLSRPLLLISATAFLLMLGLGVLFPVLPEFTRALGLSELQAGLLLGSYALASFAMSPFWGRFSERSGRRPVVLIGLLGFSVTFFLFALGTEFWQLLLVRSIGGLFAAAAMPAIFAYAADVSTPEARSRTLGMIGASIGVGVVAGPALGAFMVAQGGVRAPFYATAAIGLFAAVAMTIWLPESLTPEIRAASDARRRALAARGFTASRISVALAPFLTYSFLVQVGRTGLDSTVGFLVVDRLGGGTRDIGILLTGVGVIAVLVQGGGMRVLTRRFSDHALMMTGTVLLAGGLLGVGHSASWGALWLWASLLGVGSALLLPTFTAELSRAAEGLQGEAQGLNTSVQSLARAIGPVLATSLYRLHGPTSAYVAASVLVGAALLVARGGLRTSFETAELPRV
jgi:MFS transporter, DHA1 family, multidrug resistance protein